MPGKETYNDMLIVIKDDWVKEVMEFHHVLEEDVKKVIHHSETTQEKLYKPGANRFLAKKVLDEITFYVEYSIEKGNLFAVYDVYWHKIKIGQ